MKQWNGKLLGKWKYQNILEGEADSAIVARRRRGRAGYCG